MTDAANTFTIPSWPGLGADQRTPDVRVTNRTGRAIHEQLRQVPAANRHYGAIFGETWVACDPDIIEDRNGYLYLRSIFGVGQMDSVVAVEIAGDSYTPSDPEGGGNYRGDWEAAGTWTGPYTLPYNAQVGEIYRLSGKYYVVKTAFTVTDTTGQNTPAGNTYKGYFGRIYADTNVNAYLGEPGQGVDPLMVECFGAGYDETLEITWYGHPVAFAYVTAKLPLSEFNEGRPSLRILVRGWRCYDPRSGLTAFTRNPVLHLATFLESPLVGLDTPVKWSTVVAPANRCEDAFPDGPRIEHNQDLSSDPVPTEDWKETLRGYAGVFLEFREGQYHFELDAPRAVDWHLVFADPASDAEMKGLPDYQLIGHSERKNVVRVKYTDTSTSPWKQVTLEERTAAVESGAEQPQSQDYGMPGILVEAQARRYAKERLAEHQGETWVGTVPVADEGLTFRIGQLVSITSPNGMDQEVGRVLGTHHERIGLWLLRCRQYYEPGYQEPT